MKTGQENLLIYAPVPLYRSEEGLFQESQACNGLRLWAENFDTVTAMMPVMTGAPPSGWCPVERIDPNLERITIVPLPIAYRPDQFLRHLPSTKLLIRDQIARADYLSFAIGGLFGDWGAVSCYLAYKMGRPYSVWTDRVESAVVRRTAHVGNWRNRLRSRLTHRPMFALEKYLIRRSSLGLFHGKETYDTYAPFCTQPEVVHNIHVRRSEHISAQRLEEKRRSAQSGPLKIAYVGRADAMKGPLEWVAVLRNLSDSGVDFQAIWLGDGPELAKMRKEILAAGMQDRVEFPGFTSDRQEVMCHLQDAHVFMFCHKTPESPRCLIEALLSGAPIVGYDGAFAADLVSKEGGGILSAPGDVGQLTRNILELEQDRRKLAGLISKAAVAASIYDEESVFKHRSDLIRQYL